ncbi:hypothetical protein QR685DRAFT_116432 [Neurospora intermedia]|uniref:Uncharacterized protein n=1 Tax=Neurospora intermedia TaxID=5142 RepID=A0ABR3D315_NEUIN
MTASSSPTLNTETATTWNSTQQHTSAEYFVKYNMETIPESSNGELPPRPSGSSHGSRGHAYIPNLHVPKRSNTFSSSTSTSQYNHQRHAAAEQERPSSALSRSFSPLSPPSPSDSSSSSRMMGGGKSTQRVKEWVIKRSNSTREPRSKPGSRSSSSSNSGDQNIEIIHLGGGRVDPNGHVHTSALSPTYTSSLSPTLLSPPSRARTSFANSIDSRVTQWGDLYHDSPESLTVTSKPGTATGKPPRPASPELHERPQLRELGLGGVYNGGWGQQHSQEEQGEGHQSRHRHTKSDGSIHPAPLRLPSNSSSSSSSVGNQDGGAAVTTQPEETWMPQGLTRSDSKWKPLPVPPPPGAPGSITPLADGGRRAEENINMAGAICYGSPLTSIESESEFGEREDTPTPKERYNQGAPHIVNVMVQNSSGSRTARDRPSPPPSAASSFSNDVSGLGIGYGGVGLGVMSPPLTPPETKETDAGSSVGGGIRESMWPVPPSYSLSQTQPPSRSASPEKQQHQHHQQKPSASPSLPASTSPALASSVPTHMIPKRSDSLSYSRSAKKPYHAPQALRSTASTSSLRTTEKSGHSSVTEQIAFDTTTPAATTVAPTPPLQQHKYYSPTITPPTPIVQSGPSSVASSRGRTTPSSSTPSTPTWRPRASLSSKEMLWLHRNYRGITAFMTAWGLNKGLGDEAESKEGLSIMRELMAAELAEVHEEEAVAAPATTTTTTTTTKKLNSPVPGKVETSPRPGQVGDVWDAEDNADYERASSNYNGKKNLGKGDNSGDEPWLEISPGEKNVNGSEKEHGYASTALKGGQQGQGVRMMSPRAGSAASTREGSDFI